MKKRIKILRISILVLAGLLILFLMFFAIYSIAYAGKVYLNQYAGDINLSGKSKEEVTNLLTQRTKEFSERGIVLVYKSDTDEKKYEIKPTDLALQYDIDSSIDRIWSYGRQNKIWISFWQQLTSIFRNTNNDLVYTINSESLNSKINSIAAEIDQPEKDFSIYYDGEKFALTTDKQEGRRIDQVEIKENIKNKIANIQAREISFLSKNFKPQVNEDKAVRRLGEANGILKSGALILKNDNQQFELDNDTIGGLVKSQPKDDDLEIQIDQERLNIYVDNLAKNINTEPQNARLSIVNGKATVFETAKIGKTLDKVQTKVDIENALFARIPSKNLDIDPKNINLKVEIKKPEITDDTINNLGIKELVGTGTTDFKKSPQNRIHNIQVGAAAVNGTLLKPGDTFSILGKLGKIDASSGYLEELVIKENRTTPEFGGGLCQVSSTLFRAAMNAGLKITERVNHKYRVSYYEPPVGMDATIYDPAPDFKFINNYSTHLLIQSRIDGTKITFEIYGTKDERIVEISEPEVYDYVDPGAPVMVETDTLPAGEKKQIEKAHQGASAKFNYKVTRANEILQEKTFVSKYVPWPEKWLVGKGQAPVPAEPVAEPAAVPSSTCTDAIQNGDETGTDCGGSCPTACAPAT